MGTTITPRSAGTELRDELARWFRENGEGGWRTRWRRRPVWPAQLAQKLGLQREVEAPLFFGARMRVVTGESVSRGLLTFGYSECAITALLLALLHDGDGVIDVGTHFGYEALLAARLVGPRGVVYSFEPNPWTHRLASANLGGHPQCRLRQAAVGAEPGVAQLHVASARESAFAAIGDHGPGATVEVPVVAIDEVVDAAVPIHVFKCDAEGYELAVLRGARQTIARHRPILLLEVGMRGDAAAVTARTVELADAIGAGYEPLDFEYDGRLHIGPPGSIEVGHANIAFVPIERCQELLSLADVRA